MSYLIVVLLSILWAAVFLPGVIAARRSSSPYATATTFQRSLARISTGRPAAPGVPAEVKAPAPMPPATRKPRSRQAAQRRELIAIVAAVGTASVVLAATFGGAARWVAVLPVLVLVGHVAALRYHARTAATRRARRAVVQPPAVVVTPPPATDGVVPSVRRRRDPAADDLERIAG